MAAIRSVGRPQPSTGRDWLDYQRVVDGSLFNPVPAGESKSFPGAVSVPWSNRLAVTTDDIDERSRAPYCDPYSRDKRQYEPFGQISGADIKSGVLRFRLLFLSHCISPLGLCWASGPKKWASRYESGWAPAGPRDPKTGPLDTNRAGPLLGPCQPVRIENDCPAAEQKRQRGMKEIRPKRALSFTDEGYTVRGCGTS